MDPSSYFDVNGSTPPAPEVLEAFTEWSRSGWGNASADHPEGRRARAAIAAARAQVASGLGARVDEVWFTSGGTESNNWALIGAARAAGARRRHLVVSAVEHKSVLRTAQALEREGCEVTVLPVTQGGVVQMEALGRCAREDTVLVAVMLANNETGVVQPIPELARWCRERGVLLHCDAVAAVGKVPVDFASLGCDSLSVSSHKLYAPKGCGALLLRRGVLDGWPAQERTCAAGASVYPPLVHGCGQQEGMRGGTENTAGAVALGIAIERLARGAGAPERVESLRDRLWRGLRCIEPGARRNGAGRLLPNTLNVTFPGRTGAELQRRLGERGISVAAGAAATNGAPSYVLTAMGLSPEDARGALRFSLGSFHDEAAVDRLLERLEEILSTSARVPATP